MFKFDFNLEDAEDKSVDSPKLYNFLGEETAEENKQSPLITSTVEDLVENLPPLISYSPLRIPISGDRSITLLRRDLFDARFQLISESTESETSDNVAFIDAPSDLVPGVYEGGLKTWECSSDLAGYLEDAGAAFANNAHRILEVGCGTAVPSLYLLHKLLHARPAGDSTDRPRTTLHLQDYNLIVLQLVTLPNILLTWYASPESEPYRATQSPPLPEASVLEPGELSVTPELLFAFMQSLRERKIYLEFISGPWTDTEAWICQRRLAYDLVLTSETIYQTSSLPSLVSLLHSTSAFRQDTQGDEELPSNELSHLSLRGIDRSTPCLCLVAAKVIYFGVGGGVDEFEKAVKEVGGETEIVSEWKAGVARRIMKVAWHQPGS